MGRARGCARFPRRSPAHRILTDTRLRPAAPQDRALAAVDKRP